MSSDSNKKNDQYLSRMKRTLSLANKPKLDNEEKPKRHKMKKNSPKNRLGSFCNKYKGKLTKTVLESTEVVTDKKTISSGCRLK